MKNFSAVALTILTFILFFAACKHTAPEQVVPPPPAGGGGGGTGTTLVCFESEVLPIFQSNCAKSGCHDAITHEKGYVLDSYANIIRKGIVVGSATNSEIYEVLFETGNDKMPPAPNPDLHPHKKLSSAGGSMKEPGIPLTAAPAAIQPSINMAPISASS